MTVLTCPGLRICAWMSNVDVVSDQACDNCGFPDVELVRVRRVYVVPASWDHEGSETVVPEPELWCVSCCSQYPNDPADGD